MKTPEDQILFNALQGAFSSTEEAIEFYRGLAAFVQNSGQDVTPEELEQFYQDYLELRQAVYDAFIADIAAADNLYQQVVLAVRGSVTVPQPPQASTGATVNTVAPAQVAYGAGDNDQPWMVARDNAQEILSKLPDLPSKAGDFAASVENKLQGMIDWMEKTCRVTEKMEGAIDRMGNGVDAWLDNDRRY